MRMKRFTAIASAMVLALSVGSFPQRKAYAADYVAGKKRVSVHDPSIFKDDKTGMFYVFGSHIDAAKSTDLQNWQVFTNGYATSNNKLFGNLSGNLQKAFAWAGEDLQDCAGGFSVWAPDVIWNPDYINPDGSKGAYLMYFCTSSDYRTSVIAYAASQNVEGPYTFVDTLIYSGFTENDQWVTSNTKRVNRKYTSTNINDLIAAGQVTYNAGWFNKGAFNNQMYPNAIDPTIYYDTDGKMYMCYGSWSGGIFTLEMDKATGKCIHPKTGKTEDGRMVDSYFGTKISGGYGKSGEGPFIEYNPETGYYYLWVTYGGLFSDGGYNMRVARSKDPMGPYKDAADHDMVLASSGGIDGLGVKVMGNYKFSSLNRAYMACGHNSVLRDDDGQWYLFNHARFDDGSEYHEVRVHAMKFNEAGWPVVMPYEYSGDAWSEAGYVPADLAGTYEFLNHGNATDGKIITAANITLGADGTISGAATGSWKEADNSAEAIFSIGDVNYKGYFALQYDETGKGNRVMTFTAVGKNNLTIWGVQTKSWSGKARNPLGDFASNSKLKYDEQAEAENGGSIRITGTKLLSNVPYFITNANSNLVLDLTDGSTADGTGLQQWAKTGGKQQEWRVTDLGNGFCRLTSMADETKCIAVAESTAENGTAIVLQTYTGSDNQQWKLVQNGSYYGIVSKCSADGAGLDVYEWSTKNGGVIKQWEYWGGECQLWKLVPTCAAVTEGSYTIRNVNSGQFVQAADSGLVQNPEAAVWTVTAVSDGYYTVTNAAGLAVTATDGENGTDLTLTPNSGSKNQQFAIQSNADGSYTLLSAASDKKAGFDVYEVSTEAGAKLCQWEYWGGEGQKFVLSPTMTPEVETTTTTTTTTTMTTTETTTTESVGKLLLGDADCNGEVNVSDAVLIARCVANDKAVRLSDQGNRNADCNIDSKLDDTDLVLLLKHLAKIITLDE